jgi:alkanesulfonate monooxygenase SsuD/methylene tetrahydromethanopterin reductase-like flavin-dependent oxidoreductase (luciferase family)
VVDRRPGAVDGKCRRAEELGYDVITVPDHLGKPSPFPALSVAAAVTERPRVGTMVINVPFYNPTLLARDSCPATGSTSASAPGT